MRIAYRADPQSANAIYRAHLPMGALAALRGHEVRRLFNDEGQALDAPLDDIDVVYVHRYANPAAQQLVQRAQAAGAAVVWDNDDDMGSMPRSIVSYKHFGGMAWERRLAQMRQVFRFIDVATAPSTVLAERFASWGAPAVDMVENYVADECYAIRRRPRSGTTIGWIAGGEHAMDVQNLPIADVLQRLLDERGDVRVVTVGLRLGLRSERYEHVQSVPLVEITQRAAEFDVAIAPLADLPFNRSRSNVKLKEYAAGGTPWLASPIGPYAGMGEKQGGRLVPDDGWDEAILRLIDKPRERRKLAKRAARWGAGEALSKHLGRWEALFEGAVARRQLGAPAQKTA